MTVSKLKSDKIGISGIGCISAAGQNVEEHLYALKNKVRNCGPVPRWLFDTSHNYPVFSCGKDALTDRGKELLSQKGKKPKNWNLSRTIELMVSATSEALSNALLSIDDLKNKSVGIAIGTTVGCTFNNEHYYKKYREGESPDVQPVIDYLNSNLASCLHAILGTNGPSMVVTNACSSGTDALGVASSWLEAGICDIAIAGGADELSRIAYNGFVSLQLADSSACRPFDKNRQGLNLGEGAGIVILQKEQNLKKQENAVGYILGYGASSDAWHPTAPHPQGLGVVNAVKKAVEAAGGSHTIDLINAHGTGTKANDLAETNALAKSQITRVSNSIVSTKGWTGHTLGAAGAIEVILTIISLNEGFSYGTLGCKDVDPDFMVEVSSQNDIRKLNGKIGLSQSLAFGGCNSALIIEGGK